MNEIAFKVRCLINMKVIFTLPFTDLRRNGVSCIPIYNKPPKDEDDQPMEPPADCWCRDECPQDNDGPDVSAPEGCLFEWSESVRIVGNDTFGS